VYMAPAGAAHSCLWWSAPYFLADLDGRLGSRRVRIRAHHAAGTPLTS